MADPVLVRIGDDGQVQIPKEVRDSLGIAPGDYLTLHPMTGALLLAKPGHSGEATASDLLQMLVRGIGRQAEQRGNKDEDDLDPIADEVQQQAFRQRYRT